MNPGQRAVLFSGGKLKNNAINGSFENALTGWTLSAGGGTLEQSATQAKDGANSLHLIASAQTVYAYQNIPLPVGHKLYVVAWCWLASGSLTTSGTYLSVMDYLGASTTANKTLANSTLDASWQKRSVIATVGAGYSGLRIVCGRASAQTAEYFIDGVVGAILNGKVPPSILTLSDDDLKAWCDARYPNFF